MQCVQLNIYTVEPLNISAFFEILFLVGFFFNPLSLLSFDIIINILYFLCIFLKGFYVFDHFSAPTLSFLFVLGLPHMLQQPHSVIERAHFYSVFFFSVFDELSSIIICYMGLFEILRCNLTHMHFHRKCF